MKVNYVLEIREAIEIPIEKTSYFFVGKEKNAIYANYKNKLIMIRKKLKRYISRKKTR